MKLIYLSCRKSFISLQSIGYFLEIRLILKWENSRDNISRRELSQVYAFIDRYYDIRDHTSTMGSGLIFSGWNSTRRRKKEWIKSITIFQVKSYVVSHNIGLYLYYMQGTPSMRKMKDGHLHIRKRHFAYARKVRRSEIMPPL